METINLTPETGIQRDDFLRNLRDTIEMDLTAFKRAYKEIRPDGRSPVYSHISDLEKSLSIIKQYLN